MSHYKTKAAQYKKTAVKELVKFMQEYPIIAVVNMENLPASQLQKMREQLRKDVVIKMSKRRFMKLAIEQVKAKKQGIEQIEKYMVGMPALMFTKENPFALYKTIQKNKSSAPAKPGQIAPKDLIIPAGPTSFSPGPIIGELGQLGIKTGIEGGKVAVKDDKVVAKKGDKITPAIAGILSRFGVQPMEIGLNITAIYQDGAIFESDVLNVSEEEYIRKLQQAHTEAFNLAIFAGYPSADTIKVLIGKAFKSSKAVALQADILNETTVTDILGKAYREMLAVKEHAKLE